MLAGIGITDGKYQNDLSPSAFRVRPRLSQLAPQIVHVSSQRFPAPRTTMQMWAGSRVAKILWCCEDRDSRLTTMASGGEAAEEPHRSGDATASERKTKVKNQLQRTR